MLTTSSRTTTRQPERLLPTDPAERDRVFWALSPSERVAAMRRGELTIAEASRWAARAPHEIPILNGEFEYLAARTPEVADD